MGMYGSTMIKFEICSSWFSSWQQWVILKTGNTSDSIHICVPSYQICLTADYPIPLNEYEFLLAKTPHTTKPNKEARYLRSSLYKQSDTSQHWLMNSTTHQLSSVQYPKGCITTRHLKDPALAMVLECIGNDYESPNPKLSKHQSFYLMPALDKNGEQLCIDSASTPY